MQPPEPEERLEVVCVADVEMKEVEWVWPLRLARGKMTIIAGETGLGKSQIACDVAARITRGWSWPDNSERAPRGSVVILASEDAINTVRPRLEALGAKVEQVHVVKMVVKEQGAKRLVNLAADLGKLESLVRSLGDVVVVEIDPISAYLGNADSHMLTAIAPIMSQVADFAERTNVAVLAIHHPPKDAGKKAVHAFSGSAGFVTGPRFAFIAVEEPDSDRKLLLAVKTTNGPKAAGLGYRVVGPRSTIASPPRASSGMTGPSPSAPTRRCGRQWRHPPTQG